ncbi:MAG: hypothetical protein IMW89_15575 [Ktedonobacteraceae bacterium]|nr:hypothetical protein [Ktedonobacteraceae bacterium]
MSKVKMRCITCGKWFQSANAKEVTCPDCTQKSRREKMAQKNAPPIVNRPAGSAGQHNAARPLPPRLKAKPAQGGTSHWLDTLNDVKVSQPEQPPLRPRSPSPPSPQRDYRDRERGRAGAYREGGRGPAGYRSPAAYRPGESSGYPRTLDQRPLHPFEGGPGYGRSDRAEKQRPAGGPATQKPQKQKARAARPPAPPRPKKEKTPPPQPFVPTPEQVRLVEERYLQLATPTEYDGIRTQIAAELSIPKKAVKKIVKELRDRQNIPSWWELQTYKGSEEELARIRALYEPLLPLPPVGIHKQLAEQLSLKPSTVYQAIKAIRQEMNLPQYNDPSLRGPDFLAHTQSNERVKGTSEEQTAQEAGSAGVD